MWSERYAELTPLSLSYRQLPPTPDPISKQSKSIPSACSTWAALMPEEPAPMMQAVACRALMSGEASRDPGVGGTRPVGRRVPL